jgi:TonB family protein
MTHLLPIESWLFEYLLNALWQVPLIFAAAWLMARLAHRTGPHIEHRLWVAALFLEVLLPACRLRVAEPLQEFWAALRMSLAGSAGGGDVRILTGPAHANGSGLLHLSPRTLTAIGAVYGCTLLYFIGRLAWGLWKTQLLQRSTQPIVLSGPAAQTWARLQASLGTNPAHLATASEIAGPITIGILHRLLLFPRGFLESVSIADLDAVLAHECAHMRRHDFAKNLLYAAVSLPVACHPMLWLTRSRIAESREMICDALAAESSAGRESYARSLLRLASTLTTRKQPATLHAIGIFDANLFERRIMKLTRNSKDIQGIRRYAIVAACALAAGVLCASAMALRVSVAQPIAAGADPTKIHVKSDDLIIVSKVNPIYPEDAKKARVEGSVVLNVILSKEGVPENIRVVSGPHQLQKSALDAVRQWRYQPYLLNGNPVEVETSITVSYSLAG